MTVELRRFKDIVAMKWGQKAPIAFHSLNMEVAEISDEAFEAMSPTDLLSAEKLNLRPGSLQNQIQAVKSLQEWNNSENSEAKDLLLPKKIRSLTLNVTQICNLHCVYCAAGGDGSYGDPTTKISIEKTLPQLRIFLDQLNEGDTFHITFLGGEPLLYPAALTGIHQYLALYTAGRDIKLSYSIITNATLLTAEMIQSLAPLQPQYTVSFDGPKATQDRLRPQKNGSSSYEDTLRGLKLLLNAPEAHSRILIHSVFTAEHTDVEGSYRFFSEFPVDAMEFTFDVTSDNEIATESFIKSMDRAAALAFAKGGEKELRKITVFNQYFDLLDNQTRNLNYCGAGKTLLSVDAKNRIFVCPLEVNSVEKSVGNGTALATESYLDLQNENLVKLNECDACWAKTICGGGCMFTHQTLTGSRHRKSPQYCKRQRSLITTALMYYQLSRA